MDTVKQKDFLIKSAFYITVTVFAYFVLKLLSGPLLPFALSALITVLLQRLANAVSTKFRIKKKAVSVAAVLTVYILAGCLLTWIGYALYRQLNRLIDELPQFVDQVSVAFQSISDKINGFIGRLPDGAESIVGKLPSATVDSVTGELANFVTTVARNVAAGVPLVVLAVVVMIVSSAYFAKDYDEICRYIKEKLPKNVSKGLVFAKNNLLSNVTGMLKGYVVIMAITFIELFIGLSLIGSEYALVIAAITAIVDILPVFGSGTVLVPWAIFAALFGNTRKAISIIILYVVITAVRNFAEPKVIGKRVGLHPIVMLASVFLGLKFFGAAGILVLPLAVIVVKDLWLNDDKYKSASLK